MKPVVRILRVDSDQVLRSLPCAASHKLGNSYQIAKHVPQSQVGGKDVPCVVVLFPGGAEKTLNPLFYCELHLPPVGLDSSVDCGWWRDTLITSDGFWALRQDFVLPVGDRYTVLCRSGARAGAKCVRAGRRRTFLARPLLRTNC